jgi:nucleoside-diphosphate-sugar epimerase
MIATIESRGMPSTSRVLLTGATGFVGRNLLALAPAVRFRAAARSISPSRQDVVEVVAVGNIDARTDWRPALTRVDSVVHLAARVHVMNPTPDDRRRFDEVNIAGTRRLAAAAAQAGVKRFVFLSTVKVNGENSGTRPFRADDPPNPGDDYSRSKFEGERELGRIGAESGMQTVCIRSPLVYGPGVGANFLRLLAWAHRAMPLPLASIDNSRSLVSVWNLCDLIHTVLRHAGPIDRVLMVSDGRDVSTPVLIRMISAAMHRPTRLFPMPLSLLRTVGRLAGATEQLTRLCSSLQADIQDTRERLNWSPPLTLEMGLSRTADWYLDSLARRHD